MGFKDAARGFVKGFFTPNQSNINIASALPNTAVNYQAKVGRGLRSSVVMAPVHWAARSFAELRPAVSFDGETVSEHSLLSLYRTPNQFYTGSDLQSATIMSYLLSGNAYWLMVRDERTNQPVELWYAPHWMIKPQGDENNFIAHYEYRPDGRGGKRVIAPSDVLHFRCGIDPEDVRLGISPLASLWREIYTDDEASNYTASLLRNQGLAGAIISPAAGRTVAPSEMTAARRYITERLTGDRRGQPIIMSGSTTITQPSFSPQNMMLGELRNVPEERVCAILGIPAAVVGFGTGLQATKVGATMKESVRLAWTGCLLPMARTFESTINSSLLREFETSQSAGFIFSSEDVAALKDDQNEAVTRTKELYSAGIINRAQALSSLGMESRDGDEDIYSVVAPAPMFGEMRSKSSGPTEVKARMSREQAIYLDKVDKLKVSATKEMASDIEPIFIGLGKEAGKAAEKVLTKARGPIVDLDNPVEQRQAEDIMTELTGSIAKAQASLAEAGGKAYSSVALATYSIGSELAGVEYVIDDVVATRVLREGGTRLGINGTVDIAEQTRKAVFKTLSEASQIVDIPDGLARAPLRESRKLAAELAKVVEASPWADVETRSAMIARTETSHAHRESVKEFFKQSERVERVLVVDARLGPTDADCMNRNGKIVTLQEAESIVPDHPNCTLDFIPYFEPLQETSN